MQKTISSDHKSLIKRASLELEAIKNCNDTVKFDRIKPLLHERSFKNDSIARTKKSHSFTKGEHSSREIMHIMSKLNLDGSLKNRSQTKRQPYFRRHSDVADSEIARTSEYEFPPSCLKLLYSLPGNQLCVDCGAKNPEWASVSYGVLLCLQCCGKHRRLGVQVSFVRSIHMDRWTCPQILSMLEGGNEQLTSFFRRQSITPKNESSTAEDKCTDIFDRRYETKAAQFYRKNLDAHVKQILANGEYKGREAARKKKLSKQRSGESSRMKV